MKHISLKGFFKVLIDTIVLCVVYYFIPWLAIGTLIFMVSLLLQIVYENYKP